jgi:stearoyl-CoA desaturase (delta-9 desaturase)
MIPIGIIIGGEELHNNHHLEPANPKLSRKWFEFDIGWMWLSIFKFIRLAKTRIKE